MNSHSPAPSSGQGRSSRDTATRSGRTRYMSERQTEAYLLARDAVRRVQRTSSWVGAISQQVAGCLDRAAGNHQQSH